MIGVDGRTRKSAKSVAITKRQRGDSLTKDILAQYCDLQEEVKDLRRRIRNKQNEIDKIEEDGAVTDTVTRGKRGKKSLGTTYIEGFPYPEYSRKRTALYLYKAQLENAELELLEITNEVEEYIQSLNDSRMRRILRHRFMDSDNPTWYQVAMRIGARATEDSIKKEFQRFMEDN